MLHFGRQYHENDIHSMLGAILHGQTLIVANQEKLMSQVTDFAEKEQVSLDAISTTLDGIVTGVTALDTLITNLQNSPGTLTTSDQAALDAIQAKSQALVAKVQAISVNPPA